MPFNPQWSTQGQAHSWVLGVGTQEEFDQPSLPGSSQDTVWWEARGLREAWGPWSLDALPARGARGGWGVLGLFATVPPGPWALPGMQ